MLGFIKAAFFAVAVGVAVFIANIASSKVTNNSKSAYSAIKEASKEIFSDIKEKFFNKWKI